MNFTFQSLFSIYCSICSVLSTSLSYFFHLNKSLHLFETHCAVLPIFNPNIDLLQAVKVTKSGHCLSHDRASKGYGSIPCLTSQTYLHACSQGLNTMQIYLSKKNIFWGIMGTLLEPLWCSILIHVCPISD